ncbi:MAG: BMP family ABC transporter substrate-binding protein [Oscillibacter sp.]|nr:BMP family ABC transporter substrate-binding protein [Oscillibacter sp.]
MKKLIAMILASLMVLSLAACGGGGGSSSGSGSGDMKVAMITDSGDITDQSFNQTTYETAKAWSEANGASFTYYKPEKDSDEARNAAVDLAAADGANIIIMPGYMFAATLVAQTNNYPDVKFIALDVADGDICEKGVGEGYDYNPSNWNVSDYYNTDNTYCAVYQEQISGYMAGYAAVKLGYRHLGFLGGMAVPAVMRFGYGYVQGANAAAEDLGVSGDVTVEYVYGGQFYGDADITAAMDTWYNTLGVEVVFACGGGIYTSAAEAAAKVGGKVIGVDSDQSSKINEYGADMTVTSAMKGLDATVNMVLTDIKDGKWSDHVGKIESLGLISDDPAENYVQLPRATTQWGDGFSEDDYLNLVKDIHAGTISISDDISAMPSVDITVNEAGSIK